MQVFQEIIALLLGGAALAAVARRLGTPYPALIEMGVIVVPSDAVAAAPVLKQLQHPYRLLVILEGESLSKGKKELVDPQKDFLQWLEQLDF